MTEDQIKTWFQNQRTKLKKTLSNTDYEIEHYAKLLYIKDMTNRSCYGGSDDKFPVIRRTLDGRLAYW